MNKKIVVALICVSFLSSCAVLDFPARFLGISTQKFEDEGAAKYEKVFAISKDEGFKRSLLIIKYLRARVTHKSFNKGYIVAFDFSKSFNFTLDSTEAAFYITELDDKNIQVTLVSNNSLLARNLSIKFFELFNSTMTFLDEPEEINEIK
jgi:phosphohistidine phosphatase SixA